LPYCKRDYLLTRAERAFFEVLVRAVPSSLHVFAKVRLADLVWIPRRDPHRRGHLNRVLQKHIDFVLCERGKVAPVLAIELDDSSHQWPGRIELDEFVSEALRAAGLPLVRVPARRSYSLKEIEQMISESLGTPTTKIPAQRSRTRPAVETQNCQASICRPRG
jgi:hypothetical protein